MHHTLTALMAERYHPWIRWSMGTHAPQDHEDVPHLGGETGDGWFDLQDRLFRWWATRDEHWALAQVKEKFAELTIYANPDTAHAVHLESRSADPDWRPIHVVAAASRRVCEHCGAPGRQAEAGGWFSTVCERHRSFATQERDAAERDACPTAAAVMACLAAQRTLAPEPEACPDVDWVFASSVPRSLGQRMQILDAAITWLQELDRPVLQPADLETVMDPQMVDELALPWTPAGLHCTTITALCHAVLRSAETERQADGCLLNPLLIHLPDIFVLPR